MKLYHYIPKDSTVLTEGLLSFSKSPNVNLKSYVWREKGLKTKEDVCRWMEKCFKGRSRGIRFFTEPIKWYPHSIELLKGFVDEFTLISVDVDKLNADHLIEAVYVSPPIHKTHPEVFTDPNFNLKCDEFYVKLKSIKDIDYSPVDWSICNDKEGRRFAFTPYYLLVMKDGVIPPKYIRKVK